MCDKRLQIDDLVLEQANRCRPRVVVTIDELEIYLFVETVSDSPNSRLRKLETLEDTDLC